ncbi:MAG: hypothetical protein K2K51_08885, partial [Bacteroidales bacterium]|nr:hypothetical protein [Bacteroidales bacterium]
GYKDLYSGRPDTLATCHYTDCLSADSIPAFPVVNIGDSFSLCGEYGYLNYFGALSPVRVGNVIRHDFSNPVDDYIALLNSGCFRPGQTVILESGERSFLWRLFIANLHDRRMPAFPEPETESRGAKPDMLQETLKWIRLSCGHDNPVYHFKLSEDCFEPERYARDLYVYEEDLKFMDDNVKRVALEKLDSLKMLSEARGVHFYFIICTGKYDAYEPLILDSHAINPELDDLPDEAYIINPKPQIRAAIGQGVKNVYKVNDTHTTDIGGEIFAQCLWDRVRLHFQE